MGKRKTESFGARVKFAREAIGWTQRDLAIELDTYDTRISMWEAGKSTPSVLMAAAIAVALGVTLDELLPPAVRLPAS